MIGLQLTVSPGASLYAKCKARLRVGLTMSDEIVGTQLRSKETLRILAKK